MTSNDIAVFKTSESRSRDALALNRGDVRAPSLCRMADPSNLAMEGQRAVQEESAYARQQHVLLEDERLVAFDDFIRMELRWEAIPRAYETPNVLVLTVESGNNLFIPKRAFASEAQLVAARSLLQSNVKWANVRAKPGGFPVLPIAVAPAEPA